MTGRNKTQMSTSASQRRTGSEESNIALAVHGLKEEITMNVLSLSLGDFVKQLALLMTENQLDMPFKEETPWHLLFYRLKKEVKGKGRPEFFDSLRFDWDASYPKCQELSDFIQALHWTGTVIAVNPTYEKIILQQKVGELWSNMREEIDSDTLGFLDYALKLAREEFPGKSEENVTRADA